MISFRPPSMEALRYWSDDDPRLGANTAERIDWGLAELHDEVAALRKVRS